MEQDATGSANVEIVERDECTQATLEMFKDKDDKQDSYKDDISTTSGIAEDRDEIPASAKDVQSPPGLNSCSGQEDFRRLPVGALLKSELSKSLDFIDFYEKNDSVIGGGNSDKKGSPHFPFYTSDDSREGGSGDERSAERLVSRQGVKSNGILTRPSSQCPHPICASLSRAEIVDILLDTSEELIASRNPTALCSEELFLAYFATLYCYSVLKTCKDEPEGGLQDTKIWRAVDQVKVKYRRDEVTCFIEYIVASEGRRPGILRSWAARRASNDFDPSLSHSRTATFFRYDMERVLLSELKYCKDLALVAELATLLKSHEVLYSKIFYLRKHLSHQQIQDLLISSYDKKRREKYTDMLLSLQSEKTIKKFIIETKHSTPLFFALCSNIDLEYVNALLYNRKYIRAMSDESLRLLTQSQMMEVVGEKRRTFRALVREIAERNIAGRIDVEHLLRKDQRDALWRGTVIVSAGIPLPESLLRSIMKRSARMLSRSQGEASSDTRIMDEKARRATIRDVVRAFFVLEDPSLLSTVLRLAKRKVIKRILGMSEPSAFYICCISRILSKGLLGSRDAALARQRIDKVRASAFACSAPDESREGETAGVFFCKSVFRLMNKFDTSTLIVEFVLPKDAGRHPSTATIEDAMGNQHSSSRHRTPLLQINQNLVISYEKERYFYVSNGGREHRIPVRGEDRILLKVICRNGGLFLSGEKIGHLRVSEIEIHRDFCGCITHLIYFSGTNSKLGEFYASRIEFYRRTVQPLQRWLFFKKRGGLVLTGEKPYVLQGHLDFSCKNLIPLRNHVLW